MSYTGAQIFEAIGLQKDFVEKYFTGTRPTSKASASSKSPRRPSACTRRPSPTTRSWPPCSTPAANTPTASAAKSTQGRRTHRQLQHATRSGKADTYKEYAKLINDQTKRHLTLRGLFEFKPQGPDPAGRSRAGQGIVKRFATGAMSLGSISTEAHTTLAIAMNRIGGKSNTGEGGEDAKRFAPVKGGALLSDIVGKSASNATSS